jgi:hypothetical protein
METMKKILLLFRVFALMTVLTCALGASAADTLSAASSLDNALNVAGGTIHFTSSGTYPWIVKEEGELTYAKSSNAGISSSSSMLTSVVNIGRPSILSFDFQARGEGPTYDRCMFTIDGAVQFVYGARDNGWETYSVEISAGTHTLMWVYIKDGSFNPDGDYFAVDNVAVKSNSVSIPGDADGDGKVSISDITALIDYLLSGNTSGIDLDNADMNQDGKVNINDVTDVIDYLLRGDSSSIPGDADGDGKVNINDVTAVIDYLLSGNASAIDLDAADINRDGKVNISDVTDLIDYLLSGSHR